MTGTKHIGHFVRTPELTELERLFCGHVHNRARGELGLGGTGGTILSDKQLLDFIGNSPPYKGCTMRQGFLDLIVFLCQLEGFDPDEAECAARSLPDEDIAQGIRDMANNFVSFQDWLASLSRAAHIALCERQTADDARRCCVV